MPALAQGMASSSRTPPSTPAPSEVGPQDDYRCFLLDPDLPADRYVTGFEVLPGNSTLVHHVAVFSVNPEQVVGMGPEGEPLTNAQVMENLQKAEGARTGWTCFGAAGEGVIPSGLPVTWAPGTLDTRGRTKPTRPGLGTEDEMCLFGLYVVPVN